MLWSDPSDADVIPEALQAENARFPFGRKREVTPMALTVRYKDGRSTFTPFAIDYARYNDPSLNAFFRTVSS